MAQDKFGGSLVETDKFGGTPVESESSQDNALVRGAKQMSQSVGITKDLALGDAAGVARRVKEADDYNRENPGSKEGQELSQAWDKGDGVWGGVKNVAGEIAKDWNEAPGIVGGVRSVAKNAKAMGDGIIAQVPNMVPSMTGMIAGGVAGAAAGTAIPIVGNVVGGAVGAFTGAAAGNTLVEGGGMLMDRLNKAGINPQDTAAVEAFVRGQGDSTLGDAAIKGSIIGAVDTATAGLGGKLLNAPVRAATDRALTSMGVDMADKAAVKTAMQSDAFKNILAQDAALAASKTGAGHIAREAGVAALDPAGEFAGEYVGQGVATGDWDAKNAALEAISSVGQSGVMYAGQKAYQHLTNPLTGGTGLPSADGATPVSEGNPLMGGEPDAAKPTGPDLAAEARAAARSRARALGEEELARDMGPQSEPPDGAAALAKQQAAIEAERVARMERDRAIESPDDEIYQSTGAVVPAVKPSEAMGIDPAAGGLSKAAAIGVDAVAEQTPQRNLLSPEEESGLASTLAGSELTKSNINGMTAGQLQEQLQLVQQRALENGSWNVPLMGQRRRIEEAMAKLQPTPPIESQPATTEGPNSVTQTNQAQQIRAEPTQAGGAQKPSVQRDSAGAVAKTSTAGSEDQQGAGATARGGQSVGPTGAGSDASHQQTSTGLNANAPTTQNNGAQAAPAGGPQTQAQVSGEDRAREIAREGNEARRQRSVEASAEWTRMTEAQRQAAAAQAQGLNPVAKKSIHTRAWADLNQKHRDALVDVVAPRRVDASAEQTPTAPAMESPSAPAQPLSDAPMQEASQPSAAADMRSIVAKQLPDMTTDELRQAATHYGPDHKRTAKIEKELSKRGESTAAPVVDAVAQPAPAGTAIEGRDLGDGWAEYSPNSGTKGIPRAEMPQIKAEHRGAMTNFMNARGIAHQEETVPASSLKPTQAEFSREKVEKAKNFEGGNRAILVSRDGHVLDGHHQWMAAREKGEDVRVIRLDAPIDDLVKAAHEFPSSTVDAQTSAPVAEKAKPRGVAGKLQAAREKKQAEQKARDDAEDNARRDYFAPGNIVHAYGGTFERVIDYKEPHAKSSWAVTVRSGTVADHYYMDLDDGAAEQALRDEIAKLNGATDAPLKSAPAAATAEPVAPKEVEKVKEPSKAANVAEDGKVESNKSTDDRFAGNKLFTADKVAAARERMKKKLGTLNSGLDPELMMDGMTIAGAYIEAGVRKFGDYAKAMVEDMGDGVKPYLLSFWEAARNFPGVDASGMTSVEESAREHAKLITPEVIEQAAEAVGTVTEGPSKRSKKTGAKGDMTLTQDWGVEHIDGYGDSARETGNDTKDAFLKETRNYLNAVATKLEESGFEAHVGRNGKPEKPVSVNESGAAGSGDVTLTMTHRDTGMNVYVTVGDTSLRGVVPTTPSGIAIMYRVGKGADRYAGKSGNTWAPVDLTANDFGNLVLSASSANIEVQTRTNQTKDEPNGNPEQTGRAADQGRAPEVSGRGGRNNDSAAPADSGDLESRKSSDVPAPADTGSAGGDGVRVPAADVGRAGPADQGGDAGDGRTRAGRAKQSDAGAGSQSDVKAPEEVSPANPGPGNFHLDNPLEIVGGTPVARFDKNMAAIELLNQLRESERQATAEEQRTLAGYTGWGSFGQELFQGTWAKPMPKQGWEKRDQWLRDHLGQEEWESAQRSITNAHYTDPPTVMAMWDMVKRMGFGGGRVLEPSMGIGNFFGMMPADIKARSQLAGIELDSLTGAMATRLYPDANIKVMGYQESKTPDNFYDVVIGNWPFENTVIADRRYNTLSPFLHDYFFLKALDQVRPGGLVVGITSNGTMDKKATRIRAALARKAELVTSIRLPSGAFQEYAGTKVVTDIVILKKRDKALSLTPNEPWINSVAVKTPSGPEVFINEFYAKNPGNVIGTTDFGHGTTRMQPGMIVHRPENMAERLRDAVELVPKNVFTKEARADHISYVTNHTADREGSLSEQNGQLFVVRGEHLAPAEEVRKFSLKSEAATAKREQELRALIDMRRKYAALIEAERGGSADDARKALRDAYESFADAHGDMADSFGLDYLRKIDDPFYPALAALTVNGKPSDILSKSTIRGARGIENPTSQDAYVLARNRSVEPSLSEIATIAGKPEAEVRAELVKSGAVFEAPNGDVVPSDIYLSGNVRQKLREAQAALADGNKAMESNVAELKKVIPEDVPYFNIESQLGATWVPAKAYAEYVAHMLNRPSADGIEATFLNGRWKIRLPDGANHWTEARTGFGTGEYPFSKLVNAAFTNQTVKIRRKDSDGNEYVDTEATDEANARIGDIRTKFGEWLWSDPERRASLEAEYNESRNSYATPKYDGSFLNFDGMALSLGRGPFSLRQHQVNAIWRALVNRRSLNAHEVGTGKTFTMGGIAVESRRYGIAKKPVLLAHNANSASVAAEIQMMYPAAKVLYIDNLDKDSIAIRMRQIANDDWDTIVMPHSLIDRLSFREDTLMEMAREDIRALEEEAYAAAEEDGVTLNAEIMDNEEELKKVRSVTAKELVKARNRIIETIKKQAMQSSREGAIPFEDLGIDMVLVDEAHEFKKPPISTRMNMKGLNTQTSNRSIALQFITRYIRANNFGGNVHTFTGTPITNTLTEIFHQMRYVMEDEMKAAGVESWDGWFGSFAKEVQDVELSAAGEYEAINRLAGFINVPELRRMIGQYMDVVFADDMPEMQPRKVNGKTLTSTDLSEAERADLLNGRTENAADRPYKKVVNVTSDLTDEQSRIFAELQGYARSWRNMRGKARIEAMRNGSPESPIITEGLANKASFDVRLMHDEAYAGQEGNVPDSAGSKASKVVANVLEVYNSDTRAAQVIFAEQGFSTTKDKTVGRDPSGKKITRRAKTFSTMRDIVERLVQGGIPREQIAIVDGGTSKEKRKEIADAMNALTVRVVIGSTDTLGVGVNMQRNLRAMHHMDAPYMPGELEQRNGRGLRQGNQWNTVLEYRYMTDRLDGRRWQILAIKQRFITAFMKANSDSRVIEGDAASDEESDIVQSFSEAAGDPRILIRAKLRKNVEALQRAERMHGNGVADARRNMRTANEAIEWNRGILRQMQANNLPERLRAMMLAQSEAFTATVQGQIYDVRKDAEEAIDRFLKSEMRMEQSGVKVASYRDQTITARWPSLSSQPELVMEVGRQEFSSSGLRGLEQQIRNFPGRIEKVQATISEREGSIERLDQVSKAPFARAADLEAAQKRLEALEKDIEINPVPPPAWLRAGAPVDSEAFRAGKPFVVTGHRWTKDGWFVLGQDAKGEMSIPFNEVMDAQGMPLYEEREFQAPEVIEREDKAPSGGTDTSNEDVQYAGVSRPPVSGGNRVDRAVMEMVREGKSARDILRFVADASTSRFNRQVARLLLKSEAMPTVGIVGDLGSSNGFKHLAKYNRAANALALTDGAQSMAEQIFLHEMIHAATLKALDKKGVIALQMQALFRHAQKQGGVAGAYGMKNLGEFVAEAFTNPEFQRALKAMSAPPGNVLKSAWDGFVRILKTILGLPAKSNDALSRALELGVQVMREDKAMRQREARESAALAAAREFLDGVPVASMTGDEVPKLGAQSLLVTWAAKHFEKETVDGAVKHPVLGEIKLDRRSAKDSLSHGYGKNKVQALYILPEVLPRARILSEESRVEGQSGYVLGAPVEIGGQPYIVAMVVKKHEGRTGLYVHEVVLRERLQEAINTGAPAQANQAGQSSRGNPGAIRSVLQKIYSVKSASPNADANFGMDDDHFFGAADLRGIKKSAMDQINQTFTHEGKVSRWFKTVGTMGHLAKLNPAFKPVFDSAQQFNDDISMMANDSANHAPRLIPRVEGLGDIIGKNRKTPVSAADNKAVAKPLFEGTLLWTRDIDGKPILAEDKAKKYANISADEKAQMMLKVGKIDASVLNMWKGQPLEHYENLINSRFESKMLKPGIVWTEQELKSMFKMNDEQVGLYREARSTIDRSIDMTARADMLRAAGEHYEPMRDAVLEATSLSDALTLLVETMEEEAKANPEIRDRLADVIQVMRNRFEDANRLKEEGYAPLQRYGRYTVDVVDKDGVRQYFGMFETARDSNQMALRMKSVFPGAAVTSGTMSEQAFKLFQGVTPETLERFGEMLGLKAEGNEAQDKAFQEYLKLTKNNHSALKRLIHRKGIEGYSEDVGRVLASFVYSNARLAAGGLNVGTMDKAINDIPKEQGELRDVAMSLRSYIQDPQEEGQAIRGMLFAQYLGGSLASAFVNLTQPFAVTMPWLSQYGGMKKAGAAMAKAFKDMSTKGFKYEADLANELKKAEDDGVVSPQEIHFLMAQARGAGTLRSGDGTKTGEARAAVANSWEKAKLLWGQPFAIAEQINRRSTFIAAYRTAKEQGMADPAEFARRAVIETQFQYSKANKPKWARGAVGGTLFTFKTYSVSYLELMHRMWTQGGKEGRRAVAWAAVMLLLMGGSGGLPFMEDLEDLIDGAGQLMGYNISSKQWRKQLLRDVVGKELGDFLDQGLSGLPGAPIDVSGRLGMGNLIPGTGLFLSKPNRERDLMEVVGPAGDLVSRGFTAARQVLKGDVGGAALQISPTAVRNAAKGIDMAVSGMYKDTKGYKVLDTTLTEAASKFIGFQPRSVAEVQEGNSFMMRSKSFYSQQSAEIKAQWADALFRKDQDDVQKVRERLSKWNRDNPEQPIRVNMTDVWKRVREMNKDRTQRIADTAPKALRQQMREIAKEM